MYYKKKGYSKKNTKGHSWLFKVVLVVFGMVDVELNIIEKNKVHIELFHGHPFCHLVRCIKVAAGHGQWAATT
jgi:hypothetical protein